MKVRKGHSEDTRILQQYFAQKDVVITALTWKCANFDKCLQTQTKEHAKSKSIEYQPISITRRQ